MTGRETRAKAIAAALKGAASAKGDVVRFGMAKNLSKPEVHYPAAAFDAMTDEAVAADLRAAWGA